MKKFLLLAAAIVCGSMTFADTVAWYNSEECESLAAAFDNEPGTVELMDHIELSENLTIVGEGWTLDLAASDLSMAEGVSVALADAASLQISSSYGPASISGTINLGVGSVVTFGENVDHSGLTFVEPEIPVPTFSATWTTTDAGAMLQPVKITDQITQLSQIKKLVFGGKLGGGSMNAQKLFTAVVLDSEDENSVTYQFQLNDYNHATDCHLKVSWVKFTIGEDGLYAQQIKKGYVWNRGPVLVGEKIDPEKLPTSGDGRWGAQTGNNYAMMEFFVSSAPIATAVVREVEEGEAIVREAGRLADAFAANSEIVALADITEMSDVLTADKTIIVDSDSIKITSSFPGTIKVAKGGVYDINWTNGGANLETPTIVLAGGTLANNGTSGVSHGAVGISKISLAADSTISSDKDLYSIASNFGRFDYGLNGKTLTKDGAGQYVVRTPTLVGGGALEVLKGTLELADAKLGEEDTLAVTIAEGAALKFTNQGKGNGPQIAGTINLKGGSFTAPSALELTVTTDVEQMEVVSTTANNVTTYSLQEIDNSVAEVNGVKYDSIEEAIAAWNGGTLTLRADIALTQTLEIGTGKYGTLELNGCAITSSGEGAAISFASGSEVTITGEGSIAADSGCAITSAGLTTISGNGGVPIIGGAKVTMGSASKLTVDEAFVPETPLVVDYDWTGTFMNSTMPRLAVAHTDEVGFSSRVSYSFNPIKEVNGVLYAATMSGGAGTGSEHIFMVDYCYTVNEVTIGLDHVSIPYVFGVETDTSNGKMYTLNQKVMMVMGNLQYTTVTPEDISFKVEVESGYQNPKVIANEETITANANGYYHIRPGATGTAIVVTAEEIPTVPTWIDSADTAAVEKYNAWATAKGVNDPTMAKKAAYAFNCENTDEAIAAEEAAFVITSIEIVDGVPQVTAKMTNLAGEEYLITPVIKGSATVNGEYTLEKDDAAARFFRAFIEL